MNTAAPDPSAPSDAAIAQAFREMQSAYIGPEGVESFCEAVDHRAREIDASAPAAAVGGDLAKAVSDFLAAPGAWTSGYADALHRLREVYANTPAAPVGGFVVGAVSFEDWFASANPYVNQLADENDDDSRANRAFAREAWCAAINRISHQGAMVAASPAAQSSAKDGARVEGELRHDYSDNNGNNCAICGATDWNSGTPCPGPKATTAAGLVDEQYADVDALIAHLDSLMDDGGQGGEKWEPAQAAILGIRIWLGLADESVIERGCFAMAEVAVFEDQWPTDYTDEQQLQIRTTVRAIVEAAIGREVG